LRSRACNAVSTSGRFRPSSTQTAPKPEHLAEHGCVLEQLLLCERETVDARRDDALHVLGQRELLVAAGLLEQARELLRVERIPAGSREQRRLYLCG
jgi:hypothetical protein